ncbi:SprT-like domain-containing protein [Actinoplanes sp. NPDC023714]|uniref:SprT-like domain-containing protein n=1 Tax=Actinoplanes sp. NPDC023714 TaxID=3154322 RepID=UPI0033CEA2DB
MQSTDARALATGLMARHGLTGWTFAFDDAKTRAGVCHHGRRVIGLSRPLTALYSVEQVTDTVLHEIAHALAGPAHGHDRVWRRIAVRIGCSGMRCVPAEAPRIDGRWVGVCPAGHRTTAHRRPTRVRSCLDCSPRFDAAAVFDWTHDGAPAPMHPSYLAELGRLSSSAVTLPVGARVRLTGGGRYHGLVGTIVKRGRTRYEVRTAAGLLRAPFSMVEDVPA